MRVRCYLGQFRPRGVSLRAIADPIDGLSGGLLSEIERGRMLPKDEWVPALEEAYGHPLEEWYPARLLVLVEYEDDEAEAA